VKAATTTQAPAAPAEAASPVYASRLDDPEWYAETAADLQAELDKRQAALQQQQTAIAQAVDRITQAGLALDKGSPGMTPAEGLANLQAAVQEVQNQLDELSDLARQHDIPPGVLRG
jgi:predicted Zn-dependent protease